MINLYGTGDVSTFKIKRNNTIQFYSITLVANDTTINITAPYSYKNLLIINERLTFEGILNEDGHVDCNHIQRAHFKPLGFNFVSESEDVYSFSKKGLVLKVDVKTPNFSLNYKTFNFLAKAKDENVLNRLIGVLSLKKISIEGIFKKGVPLLTSLKPCGE